jgi:iron complex transport system permease protein
MAVTLAICAAAWAVVAVGCLSVGSAGAIGFPTREIFRFRVEFVLIASLVGAALGCAGVIYQAILRNPLADPYLLGVSSGASLASYLWRFQSIAVATSIVFGAISQQAFAFVGAVAAVACVFALAGRRGRLEPLTLLLVGVIVNAVNASMFLLLDSINRNLPGAGSPLNFLVGGIQTNLTRPQILAAAACVLAGFVVLMYLAGQMNVATLSEGEASALGVRIHLLRWVGLIVASLITASAVAVSGPIGFVGLVSPHLGRLIVGHDTRRLIPVATMLGACLLSIADAASRRLSAAHGVETILPVGVLTGLLGGPFFLLLLWQNRRRASLGEA